MASFRHSLAPPDLPYHSFTHELCADNLMSPPFSYPDSNEGPWQMVDMLPQISKTDNTPSHDRFAPSSSSNNIWSEAKDSTPSPTTRSPATQHHTPTSTRSSGTKAFNPANTNHPRSPPSDLYLCKSCYAALVSRVNNDTTIHLAQDKCTTCRGTPSSDLYLCKTCYAAVESRVSNDTIIHLAQDKCTICRGTPFSVCTNTHDTAETDSENGRRRSTAPAPLPEQRAVKPNQPPMSTRNRVAKQKYRRPRSTNQHSSPERGGPFYCRRVGCNRGPSGVPFARKDNKNVHERTVHGPGTEQAVENIGHD